MPTTNNQTSDNPNATLTVYGWARIRDRVIRAKGRHIARTGKDITTKAFILYMIESFLTQDEKQHGR